MNPCSKYNHAFITTLAGRQLESSWYSLHLIRKSCFGVCAVIISATMLSQYRSQSGMGMD